MADITAITNLGICLIVTIGGFYWFPKFNQEYTGNNRYIFHAYFCWWLSWIAWLGAWGVIASGKPGLHNWIFAFSDLNALFLIILYFFLTRGKEYLPLNALFNFLFFFIVIGAGYFLVFLVLRDRFDSLQSGWGLCLSVLSTVLVGWAFRYRYKTNVVMTIGFIYAFTQPLIFDVISQENLVRASPGGETIKFVLAILKVFWSSLVTLFFFSPIATKENIKAPAGAWFPNLRILDKKQVGIWILQMILLFALVIIIGFLNFTQLFSSGIVSVLGVFAALCTIILFFSVVFSWLKKYFE